MGGIMKSFWKRLIIITALAAMIVPAPAGGEVVDRIVAIVNDDIITLAELNAAFLPYMMRIEAQYKGTDKDRIVADGKKTILDRLIDHMLVEQESKKSGITVKDDEVMNVIKNILAERKVLFPDLLKTLEKEGTTLDAYKKDLKEQLLRQRLIRREVQSKIVISDEEIGEYYTQHRDDYEGKEAVRIKQILLVVPAGSTQDVRDKMRMEAENLRKRILAGEPFDAIAEKYSQGPSAQAGGDIGFIERGQTLPEVETAAFKLKINELSGVIQSSVGFHIISVVNKKGAGLKPMTEVRQEIVMKIEDQKMASRLDQWVAGLAKKKPISTSNYSVR